MLSSFCLAYLIIILRTKTFNIFINNIRMEQLKEKGQGNQVIVEVHFILL